MDQGAVAALVTLILAIGGGIRWYVGRRDNRKDPVPKESAALAMADQSVTIMGGVLAKINEELSRVAAEAKEAKAEAKSALARVSSLEETVETLDDSLTDAVRYIEALLRHMRNGSQGPAPTIPERLRGLIDPMLHRIEEEPPATH